jgi:hypothetical protein
MTLPTGSTLAHSRFGSLAGFALLIAISLVPAGASSRESLATRPGTDGEPLPSALQPTGPATLPLWSVRIVGSALRPRENNVSYAVNSNGSCVYVTAGSATTVWNVPITLPDGATIDTLRIYYYDNSASNLSAWFTVYDLYGAIVEEWSVSSSGTPGNSFDDSVLIGHVINHAVYSYVVNVRPVGTGATLQFCGLRLFYRPPPEIFLDGFESGDTSRWSATVP